MDVVLSPDTLRLAAILVAVTFPFLAERYVLQKRGGVFQVLFWVFIAQCSALAVGAALVAAAGTETALGQIGQVLGGAGFIAIGVVPFILLPIAIAFATARLGWRWIKSYRT